MARKILNYKKDQLGQDTGFYCGPATVQTITSGHGDLISEAVFAAEMGTDQEGTDYIGLLEKSLTKHLGVPYRSVYLEQDPPTAAQVETFWKNLKKSINAGYGVAMNWVAPPSNKPRGILGTQSPNYPNGWTYHYVAAMGYDDEAKAVWVVDSGFWPREYFVSVQQAASLITPKGYAYADVVSVETPVEPPSINAAKILARAAGITLSRAEEILPAVSAGLKAAECTNVNRIAMYFGQVGHENAGWNATEEYASGAAYEGRADLGNTQPGDGVRFKGRSWIQITGRHNYRKFSEWAYSKGLVATPTYFVDNPTELADLEWAGIGAAWYWTVARPDINTLCDNRDLEQVTRRINGGLNGLDDRRRRYNLALAAGEDLIKLLDIEGDDMSALTAAEQREMLNLLRRIADPKFGELLKLFGSRSPYRKDDGVFDTLAGRLLDLERQVNMWLVETSAERGEEWALEILAQTASGRDEYAGCWLWYPDEKGNRQKDVWAIQHAQYVLAKIAKDHPEYLERG